MLVTEDDRLSEYSGSLHGASVTVRTPLADAGMLLAPETDTPYYMQDNATKSTSQDKQFVLLLVDRSFNITSILLMRLTAQLSQSSITPSS